MKTKIWIKGRMPGLNDLIAAAKSGRGKFNAYGRTKDQWTAYIKRIVLECGLNPMPGAKVSFRCVEPNRRRDQDNVIAGARKLCLDGMVKAGIIPGDGWRHVELGQDCFDVDKFSPGVEIIIEEMGA